MAKWTRGLANVIRALGKSPSRETAAIIVAGGNSSRMGGISKQMHPLVGIPVAVRTLLAFEKADCISSVVVVAKKEEIPQYAEFRKRYHLRKIVAVTSGGETRQESVMRGLAAIPQKAKYVAISDAARCLVLPEQIDSVCLDAYAYEASIAATPATDTVKIAEKDGFLSTPDRSRVYIASTPQVFRADLYRAAAYTASKEGFVGTDDASLVEHIRHPVHLTDVGKWNLKITVPEDLIPAAAILRDREDKA